MESYAQRCKRKLRVQFFSLRKFQQLVEATKETYLAFATTLQWTLKVSKYATSCQFHKCFYVQIFLYECHFGCFFQLHLALAKILYKKCAHLTLMKLTAEMIIPNFVFESFSNACSLDGVFIMLAIVFTKKWPNEITRNCFGEHWLLVIP